MNNKSVFATNLKKQMALRSITRRDLCAALGFSYYTVSDWCNGKKYPRMDKVEILANYFGIQKSDLIEEEAEEQKKPVIDDGLTEGQRQLIDFARSLTEEQAAVALRVLRSLVEAD